VKESILTPLSSNNKKGRIFSNPSKKIWFLVPLIALSRSIFPYDLREDDALFRTVIRPVGGLL
jgi:hypothetical protein